MSVSLLADFDAPDRTARDLTDPLTRSDLPLTDVGAAERLAALYARELLMVRGRGFAVWDGRRYDTERGDALAMRLAHGLREAVLLEADALRAAAPTARELRAAERAMEDGAIDDEKPGEPVLIPKTPGELVKRRRAARAKEIFKFAQKCHSAATIASALKHVAVMRGVMHEPEDMDAARLRLNCANGTLDLEKLPAPGPGLEPEELSRAFGRFERRDFATRLARAPFDHAAQAPNFRKLLTLVQPEPEMQLYLQRVFGSVLAGTIGARTAFLFRGEGANGKSTIINAIAHVLGDYCVTVPVGAFLKDTNQSGSGPTPEIARLPGARMVRASEPPSTATLDESKIKAWTGGDEIATRKLHADFFDFTPRFKAFLSFNRTPRIASDDHGTWSRVKLVPFKYVIPSEQQREFEIVMDELRLEAAGILNWMIEGYQLYREEGLAPPADVVEATAELRSDMDTLGQFLGETTIADERGQIVFADLNRIAGKWREAQGDRVWTGNWLGRALSERGYRPLKVGRGKTSMRLGLRWPRGTEDEPVGEQLATWLRELNISWGSQAEDWA